MSVQRLVRIGVYSVFVMLGIAAQAAAAVGETTAVRSGPETAADRQATALISPRFGDGVRPEPSELARTQIAATRAAGAAPAGSRQEATARSDDEAANMADLEIVALIGAGLIAVLSLSRRRNL